MLPSTWLRPHGFVAVFAVMTIVGSRRAMWQLWPSTPSLRTLVETCCRQLSQDLRGAGHRLLWFAAIGWGVALVGCHAYWLGAGSYTHFAWLDLAAHAMGGAGVGALCWLGLRDRIPAHVSVPWLVLLTVAIGAGFEVYEFAIRSFWHNWSPLYYATDTVVDLLFDAGGGAVAIVATKYAFPVVEGSP